MGAGAELSRRLRARSPRADALLCGGGVLAAAPCLLLALLCATPCLPAAYVFIFLGETLLSLNWAIVGDILLYVVAPSRRSTAEALQIVTSHLLGDAGSPYLIGLVSDALRGGSPPSFQGGARALGRALLLAPFAAALGGGLFLAAADALPRDRRRARREAKGLPPDAADDDDDDDAVDDIVVPRGGRPTKVPVAHVLA